jgi:hypothetical protein
MRDPVVMFKGKKASGFVKPKQRLNPIASRDCAHHLLKTNRKPIASLTVHTTSRLWASISQVVCLPALYKKDVIPPYPVQNSFLDYGLVSHTCSDARPLQEGCHTTTSRSEQLSGLSKQGPVTAARTDLSENGGRGCHWRVVKKHYPKSHLLG